MAARIMGYAEFERYYEATKKELAYMKPGDTKRIARKIFDLGFPEKE